MTKPLYFYNGSTFELIGPTTPQSPIAYQTSAPTGPATGDLWIDSDGDVDTYNRQLTRYYFVATAAQTTITGIDANGLTLAYVAGSEAVYVNGALQVRGQDYTATDGTSVVMTAALAVNDVVEIFAYTAFTVANAYTKAETDSIVTALGGTTTAWTSWTPSFTNWALGNGTMDAKYKQIGKTVFFRVGFTVGSTTTKSGQLRLSLPVTANAYYNENNWFVNSTYIDSGTDTYFYTSTMSTTAICAGYNLWSTAGNTRVISATAPFTWATNDVMYFHGFYEAA